MQDDSELVNRSFHFVFLRDQYEIHIMYECRKGALELESVLFL